MPLKMSSCLQYLSFIIFFSCSCEPLCRHVPTRCRVYKQSYTMKEQCVIIFSSFVRVYVCCALCGGADVSDIQGQPRQILSADATII